MQTFKQTVFLSE